MLTEIGSSASIIGAVISLLGLGFALIQLSRLRGETRAAKEAAEETRRLLRREDTVSGLTRLNERIQSLVELQRTGDRIRSLERYPEIRGLLQEIRREHPSLSEDHRRKVQRAMAMLGRMQGELEALEGDIPQELIGRSNRRILQLQNTLLIELEDNLEST